MGEFETKTSLARTAPSIIDLVSGKQPMVGPAGCVTTLNGEIYNYKEIRADLEAQGRTFQTESDVEVLLQSYET